MFVGYPGRVADDEVFEESSDEFLIAITLEEVGPGPEGLEVLKAPTFSELRIVEVLVVKPTARPNVINHPAIGSAKVIP